MYKNRKYRSNRKTHKKKLLLLVIVLLLLVAGSVMVWRAGSNNDAIEDSINYDPPTEQELQDVDKHKESLITNNDNQDGDQPKNVVPFITIAQQFNDAQYGDRIEVRAYVSVVENEGDCKITFTKDAETISRDTDAQPDASTTNCVIMVPRNTFPSPGMWSIVVTYNSPMYSGSSEPLQVEVK